MAENYTYIPENSNEEVTDYSINSEPITCVNNSDKHVKRFSWASGTALFCPQYSNN
jgi:hypothetical protein